MIQFLPKKQNVGSIFSQGLGIFFIHDFRRTMNHSSSSKRLHCRYTHGEKEVSMELFRESVSAEFRCLNIGREDLPMDSL